MPRLDPYESEILSAYEAGKLTSVDTKSELARFKAAARAAAIKDRRINFASRLATCKTFKSRPWR